VLDSHHVFIAGGTGFIGRALIPVLLARGHHVRALVRPGSEHKLPLGCDLVTGDPLDRKTFDQQILPADTYVHLVGVPSPSPAKAQQFFNIDLPAARAGIDAAAAAGIRHFIYASVAQPAPIMKAYQQSRAQAEGHLAHTRMNATILRPFYVLGPGRRWPLALVPFYSLMERVPRWRTMALRLGLVTIEQFVGATIDAIEYPPTGTRFLTVPDIREARPRR
jgi:nucleoside-diphosphate-sugar epimerase